MWKPQLGPAYKVNLEVEDQAIDSPITTQLVVGTIFKPTYVSQGEGLTAKVENIPALKGKSLLIGDSSELLSQNIAFGVDSIKNGKYEIKFDYLPIKSVKSHVAVFDLRNSASKQIFTLSMNGNMNDLSIVIDGKEQLFPGILRPDVPANFDLNIDFDKWNYQLLVNGNKLADGALNTVDNHNLVGMVFWTPGASEFAIKNLVADKIK